MRRILVGLFIYAVLFGANALATNLTFDFNNASCSGTAYQIGYTCTYSNVASNVKAVIKLVGLSNAKVNKFDDESLGVDDAFQPRVSKVNGTGWGYAEFAISFFDATDTPILLDFPATSVDVDGNGYNEKEGVAYLGIEGYTLEQNTNLEVATLDSDRLWYQFYARTYTTLPGIDYTSSNAPKHMVRVDFRKRHAIRYRAYVYLGSGSSSSSRMFSAYFKDSYNGNNFPNWANANQNTVGRLISGRVFEDVVGNGEVSGDPGSNQVTARLFKGDGTLLDEVITGTYGNEDGWYSFVAPAAERFVVVDSKTLSPSSGFNTGGFGQGDVWAEQTYGAGGSWGGTLCDDDADSSTDAQPRSSTGACYGGRHGGASDDAGTLASAEHVAQVVASNDDASGVDFGFSFNVVTNVNDRDDDANNDRTAQGSLRQFIQNANAIQGANVMRFVPAVPANASGSGGDWWHIDIALDTNNDGTVDILPPITDDDTTVDGTAYSYTDGSTVRNTNPGTVGGNVYVGTGPDGVEGTDDEHYLAPFDRPELEIQGHDAGNGALRRSAVISVIGDGGSARVSGAEVANLAIYDQKSNNGNIGQAYNQAVYFYHVNGGSAHDMLLGVRADGAEPANTEKINTGFVIEDASNTNVSKLYIAHTGTHGVAMGYEDGYRTDRITFSDLEIFDTGQESSWSDGFELQGTANSLLKWSYIHDNHNTLQGVQYGASNVELWYGTTYSRIEDCTLERADNHGVVVSGETYLDYSPQSTDNVIIRNVIRNSGGPGVLIALYGDSGDGDLSDEATQRIRISKNAIYGNAGVGIDILPTTDTSNGDGVTPNDGDTDGSQQNTGIDYPIFTLAEIDGSGQLHVQGYVGTNDDHLSSTFTIEVYKADDDGNNDGEVEAGDGESVPHGEGRWYLGSCTSASDGTFDCALAVPGGVALTAGDPITGTATDNDGNTSEFGANALVMAPSPYAGQVVINEVLYRQTGTGSSGNDEFIEIYNASDSEVSLDGWRLADGNPISGTDDGVDFTFPSEASLPPGGYAVVWVGEHNSNTEASNAALQYWMGRSPQLNNNGDDVQLYDNQGQLVDYVAYGSGSAVDPPPLTGVWDDSSQGSLASASQGQSISLTPNGQDGNSSKCWELTTSGDASSGCTDYLPTIDTDPLVVNGHERVTSVGVSNNGVPVSGNVYEDAQPNMVREPEEDWANGTTVYVKLIDGSGSVVSVAQVDPGTGAYQFDAVTAGSYTLIVDDNGSTTDTTPNPPAGWLFINPDSGSRTVTVETSPVSGQDFGLFHGARVEGVVFRDTGDGTGTANDALQNGDEPGVSNVVVSVSDGNHTRTAQTDASGRYLLYVPADWGNVTLSHGLRPASGYNTGGSGVHQAANWADASGAASSAASINLGPAADISGQTLAGFNFGVVYKSSFRPDQNGSATSPGAVTYAHTYKPGTLGTVSFSRTGGDYTYQLRLDWNCDGDFDDGGEEWQAVSATDQPSFTVSDSWPRNPDGSFKACNVEVRVLVPDGEPEGTVDIAQISASLAWANNNAVADPASLADTTTVRTHSTLQLEKVVRNVTQNSGFDTSAAGQPGDVLEYCIRYRNIGAEDVTQVAISDPVPFFADMVLGVYNGKDILWSDAGGTSHELTAAADGDEGQLDSGVVVVHAENTLQPGAGGEVCYQVRLR